MTTHKTPQSAFRLSAEAKDLLTQITAHYFGAQGNMTATVELIIRDHARSLGITPKESPQGQ